MNSRISIRYIVPAALVLAMLGFVATAWAAKSGTFRATGTATFVSQDTSGRHFVFSVVGRSNPGGDFTGGTVGHTNATFQKQVATTTLDYGGGNTLTIEARLERQADGSLVGPYVVTGGTGIYANATGSGTESVFFPVPDDGTRDFVLEGTLST
jgi:hypothetical protein